MCGSGLSSKGMRHAARMVLSLVVASSMIGAAKTASADEPLATTPPDSAPPNRVVDVAADTVPVLIDAGSDIVSLGDAVCVRGRCVGRVPRGTNTLERRTTKGGQLVTDFSTEIVIDRPSVVGVAGPGALRTAALATVATGAALILVAVVVPLVVCRSSSTVDSTTGRVITSDPCDRISDPVKIAWIGGLGVGITLTLVGAVALAATNGSPRASIEPWRRPSAAPPTPHRPAVTFAPFVELRPPAERAAFSWTAGARIVF